MEPPYDRAIHRVFVLEGTPLADIVGSGSIEVNSYHHQAIRDLAPSLQVSAVSEDGIVEAVWMPVSEGRKVPSADRGVCAGGFGELREKVFL